MPVTHGDTQQKCCPQERNADGTFEPAKGMVLPFLPLSLTFQNMSYFVKMPKVLHAAAAAHILASSGGLHIHSNLSAATAGSSSAKTIPLACACPCRRVHTVSIPPSKLYANNSPHHSCLCNVTA